MQVSIFFFMLLDKKAKVDLGVFDTAPVPVVFPQVLKFFLRFEKDVSGPNDPNNRTGLPVHSVV